MIDHVLEDKCPLAWPLSQEIVDVLILAVKAAVLFPEAAHQHHFLFLYPKFLPAEKEALGVVSGGRPSQPGEGLLPAQAEEEGVG